MNFFQHQERARRKTWLLVLYFCLAIIATLAALNGLVVGLYALLFDSLPSVESWRRSAITHWLNGAALAIIALGTAHKFWQLRHGGESLADMLHAERLCPDSASRQHRQLLNVVEEMSIASGIPVPQLFIMRDEPGINAFVAGFRPSETVLVVTQGTLDTLNRDELQGVIAHEFSHIFNSDMRLNLRLMALLAGILALGKVGEYLLRAGTVRGSRGLNWGGDRRRARGGYSAVAGLGLMAVGYTGLFFGRLIKSAISRQRELLADASAVQFTRDPSGLAGALIHIRNRTGSHLNSAHAEDMSHMCFSPALHVSFSQLLATHPPLDDRLHALGADWVARARVRARHPQEDAAQAVNDNDIEPAGAGQAAVNPAMQAAMAGAVVGAGVLASALPLSQQVGTASAQDMSQAKDLLNAMPKVLIDAAHSPQQAQALVMAMLASQSRVSCNDLMALADLEKLPETLLAACDTLDAELFFPLLELTIPSLKALQETQRQQLLDNMDTILTADARTTLFAWAMVQLLRDHLDSRAASYRRSRFFRYGAVKKEIRLLFSILVWAGGTPENDADAVFQRHTSSLFNKPQSPLSKAQCQPKQLAHAMRQLQGLSPLLKGPLLDAAVDLVEDDGKLTRHEIALIRTLAALLDCPLPCSWKGRS